MTYLGDWKDWEESAQRAREAQARDATVPDDVKKLLDPTYDDSDYDWPIYWLWVFDPIKGDITVATNDDKHPADAISHEHVAPDVNHAERQEGYGYKIRGGFRITDIQHKPVQDP